MVTKLGGYLATLCRWLFSQAVRVAKSFVKWPTTFSIIQNLGQAAKISHQNLFQLLNDGLEFTKSISQPIRMQRQS